MSLRLLESLVQDETSAGSDMDNSRSAAQDDLDNLIRSVVGEPEDSAVPDRAVQDGTDLTEDQDTSQASSVAKKKKVVRRKRQQKHRTVMEQDTEADRDTDANERKDSPGKNRKATRMTNGDRDRSEEEEEVLSETDGGERRDAPRKNRKGNNRMVNGYSEGRHRTENHEVMSDQEPRGNKPRRERGPPPRKLGKRAQLRPFRSLEINSTAFIDERIQQKYREIAELLSGQFEVKKSSLTRDHLHQMELLQQQYAQASHGRLPAGVLVPRSMPAQIRKEGLLSNPCNRPEDYGILETRYLNGAVHQESDEDGDAYTTIRILQTVDTAEDRRPPPSRRRRPVSAQPHPPRRPAAESEEDSTRGRSGRRPASAVHRGRSNSSRGGSGTRQGRNQRRDSTGEGSRDRDGSSEASTPRRQPVHSDHHLKNTDNPELKKWLIQKNREYRRKQKEERLERKENRKKKKHEEEEKAERTQKSEKYVKEWQEKKRKEAIQRAKDQKKQQKEAQAKLQAQKDQHTVGGVSGTKIDHPKSAAEGEKTGGASGKIRVEGVYPPPTKFVYKRPVSGRIRFMKPTPRSKTPEKVPEPTPEEKEKTMRMSYDAWLLQKRRQLEVAKKAKAAKDRELAKSEPDLSKTGRNSARGAAFRAKSAERDGDSGPDSALSVTRASLSQRPSSARPVSSIPSPLHSKSPRRPLSAKPRVRTSGSSETSATASSFKLPFPPESGVPKHVQRRQEKLFHPSVFPPKQEGSAQEGQSQPDVAEKASSQKGTSGEESSASAAVQKKSDNTKSETAPDAAEPESKETHDADRQAANPKEPELEQAEAEEALSDSEDSLISNASDEEAKGETFITEAVPGAFQYTPKSSEQEPDQEKVEALPSASEYTSKSREPNEEGDSSNHGNAEALPDAFQYQSKSRDSEDQDSQETQSDLTVPAPFQYAPRSRSPDPPKEAEDTQEKDTERKRSLSSSMKRVSFSEHATILEPPPGSEPICKGEQDMIGMDSGYVEPPLVGGGGEEEEEEDCYYEEDEDNWDIPDDEAEDDEIEGFREDLNNDNDL